jgi:hypothetical protein
LRLFHLGAAPLGDFEAGWALQALDLARGQPFNFGPQPLYVLFTSLAFALLSGSNGLARLLPALAGSSLVLLPLFLRRWTNGTTGLRQAGLIFAFGVAVDPGLVALSRLAGGLMPALAFSLLAVVLYANRRPILAGIFAGLALLAGPAVLHGALVLAAAWGLSRLLDKSLANAPNPDDTAETIPVEESEPVFVFSANLLRPTLFSAGAVLLLAGTLFLRAPQGLGALVGTLPAYLTGWAQPSGVPALRLLAGLLFYQPLVLVFAVIGLARGWMALAAPQPITQRSALLAARLSLWAAVALAFGRSISPPGRRPGHCCAVGAGGPGAGPPPAGWRRCPNAPGSRWPGAAVNRPCGAILDQLAWPGAPSRDAAVRGIDPGRLVHGVHCYAVGCGRLVHAGRAPGIGLGRQHLPAVGPALQHLGDGLPAAQQRPGAVERFTLCRAD